MSLTIIQEGHDAFYAESPRYKNPYHDFDDKLWFFGWDSAEREHSMFTDNQTLREEKREEKKQWSKKESFLNAVILHSKTDIERLNEDKEQWKKDYKRLTALNIDSGNKISTILKSKLHLDIKLVYINSKVSSLYNYIGSTKMFFLSREKITSPLKKILEYDSSRG